MRDTVRYKIYVVIVAILVHFQVVGQLITDTPWFISLNSINGNFQVHTDKLQYFNGVKPYGFEVEIGKWLLLDNIQSRYGIYSKWGVQMNYTNFNHEDLGYTLNSIVFIEPLFKARGKWRFSIKGGAGIAYTNNPYDKVDNPHNLTYSSYFAFPLQVSLNGYFFVNKQFAFKIYGSYRHLSNGGIQQPNLGINYPAYGAGVEYIFQRYSVQPINTTKFYKEKKQRMDVLLGYSQKNDTLESGSENILNFLINKSFEISRSNGLTIGGMLEFQKDKSVENIKDKSGLGAYLGNEFFIGNIRFGQQLGVYVLRRKEAPNLLFQNYYLRYIIKDKWVTGANLKVHGIDADYILFQIGRAF